MERGGRFDQDPSRRRNEIKGFRRGDLIFFAGVLGSAPLVGCMDVGKISGVTPEGAQKIETPEEEKFDSTQHVTLEMTGFQKEAKEVAEKKETAFMSEEKAGSTVTIKEGEFTRNGQPYVLVNVHVQMKPEFQGFGDQGDGALWALVANLDKHYLSATRLEIKKPAKGKLLSQTMNILMPGKGDNRFLITGDPALAFGQLDSYVASTQLQQTMKYESFVPGEEFVTLGLAESHKNPGAIADFMYQGATMKHPTSHSILRAGEGHYYENAPPPAELSDPHLEP